MTKSRQAIILITVYALALGIRVYWLSQKEALHVDEGLTVAIACYNNFFISANYEQGRQYTGKELKEASLVSSSSLKDALADLGSLWKNNRDPPHTNLYYTFLRLSLVGIKTGDVGFIIFRGGVLNLLFFTVSFIFFFLLMRLLFAENELLQFSAVFCAFLSTAAISNTLFIRPYQIQEMLFIIFCYYFVLSLGWKKYFIHEKKIHVGVLKPVLIMSLITGLTLMTGYYAVIFIGLFGLYAIYQQCKNKTFAEIPFYFVILGLGLLIAQILYPKYLSGFFSYRGTETIRTLSRDITGNIKSSVITAGSFLHKHFFSYPVITVCVFCFAFMVVLLVRGQKLSGLIQKFRDEKMSAAQKNAWYIFAASVVYLFFVMILAPYKVLRYCMPVFPFFIILPAMLINSIGTRSKKIAAMILLCGCFAFNAAREINIENLFRDKQNQYVFTENKDTPVYVINAGWSLFKYANLIPYVHDEQVYYFVDWFNYLGDYLRKKGDAELIPLPETENYDDIYLLIEYFPPSPQQDGSIQLYDLITDNLQIKPAVIESEFEIFTGEPESWFPYFKGKKIRLGSR
ncbi:MAG: hypothetical protein LBC52_07020 [Treponema sp.]|jgi:hypothetical protein|nr:hypothetical protein [Treponema sp.]